MTPRRVLVVEDVAEMRELIALLVREIDGAVVSGLAANTAEARLEIQRRRPDVVLLDLVLPGESGRDLLPWLSQEKLEVWLLVTPGASRPTGAPYDLSRGWLEKPTPSGWKTAKVAFRSAILG